MRSPISRHAGQQAGFTQMTSLLGARKARGGAKLGLVDAVKLSALTGDNRILNVEAKRLP